MSRMTTIWQDYEIDPLNLIGKAARVTVVTNQGPTSGAHGKGVHGNAHLHFGVIEAIHEHRGKVYLNEPDDNWAYEALAADFSDTYPFVFVQFRGGHSVRFDPERDAVSIEWVEKGA